MTAWALRASHSSSFAIACLRDVPGLEIGEGRDHLWLRGSNLNDAVELRLRQIPGAERFVVNGENELIPHGDRVPSGYLPACEWQAISRVALQLPEPRRIPSQTVELVQMSLVRDLQVRLATHLLVDFRAWNDWGEAAPLARLNCLSFAVCSDRRVLVAGAPLPALPGLLYCADGGILAPAGWTWSPRVDPAIVRGTLGVADEHLVLWREDGAYELVPRGAFVAARRAAVRATAESLHGR